MFGLMLIGISLLLAIYGEARLIRSGRREIGNGDAIFIVAIIAALCGVLWAAKTIAGT